MRYEYRKEMWMKKMTPLRFSANWYKYGGPVFIESLFADTSTEKSESHLIRERKQIVDGRTFTVTSFYDLSASKSADDQLIALVKMETEKEARG